MKTIRFFALLAISSVLFACEPEAQPGDNNGGTNTEQPGDNTGGNNGDNTQQEPDDPNATTFNVVSEALADAVSAWAEADTLGVYPEEGAPYAFTTSAAGITDVGMTNLGVTHLTVGQTDVQTGSTDIGGGVLSKNLGQVGGVGSLNSVAVSVSVVAETVHNNQGQRFFHSVVSTFP